MPRSWLSQVVSGSGDAAAANDRQSARPTTLNHSHQPTSAACCDPNTSNEHPCRLDRAFIFPCATLMVKEKAHHRLTRPHAIDGESAWQGSLVMGE